MAKIFPVVKAILKGPSEAGNYYFTVSDMLMKTTVGLDGKEYNYLVPNNTVDTRTLPEGAKTRAILEPSTWNGAKRSTVEKAWGTEVMLDTKTGDIEVIK